MVALGVGVVLMGLVLMVVEAHAPTAGILGGVGAVVSGVGAWLVIAGGGGGAAIAVTGGVVAAVFALAVVALSTTKALAARRTPLRTGTNRLLGSVATVRSWAGNQGQVEASGALWRARLELPQEEERPPEPGEPVVVERVNGLTLAVRRCEPWEADSP
jgi:membrane-bound ClpP family serine protease